MHVEEIRKYCMGFPEATENLQWGDDLCFKIRGKIFAVLTLTPVPQKLCFKCTAESFSELIEREDVHPAPYVGRYKWVMADRLNALSAGELKDLIGKSYEMAAAKTSVVKRESKRVSKARKTKLAARRSKR